MGLFFAFFGDVDIFHILVERLLNGSFVYGPLSWVACPLLTVQLQACVDALYITFWKESLTNYAVDFFFLAQQNLLN